MMYNHPFFGFPFARRYPPPYSYYQNQKRREEELRKKEQYEKQKQEQERKRQEEEKRKKQEQEDGVKYFEIMGIRLYLDDILIICLLFFLYNEGIEDQSLFVSLILLLLS